MTIASEVNRAGPYNGNGVTVVFAYGFRILDAGHLQVIKADADGNETTLALTTDYTVSGVGDAGGGSIATVAAPASGLSITILRNIPFTQETDLENQGAYYAETVEDALDAAAMRDQQIQEQLNRVVKIPASSDDGGGELAAQLAFNINRLAQSADEIDVVASIKSDVEVVAEISGDVALLADVSAVLSGTASAVRMDEKMFTGDGVDTTWTLDREPGVEENVLVWVGGAIQDTADYSVSGVTLTITPAVANGVEIRTLIMTLVTANDVEVMIDQAQELLDQAVAQVSCTYQTKADAQVSAIGPAVRSIEIRGDMSEGDGLGGLYIDTDNGSTDTFVSGDARTWYRVADVSLARIADDVFTSSSGAVRKTGGTMSDTLYFDNGSDPDIPTFGADGTYAVKIGGTLHFAIMKDTDGDSDYDADIWSKDNMYIVAEAGIHLRPAFVEGQPEQGRIRIWAENSTNYIQSGRNFSGSTENSLAITKYGSSFAWALYDVTSNGWCGLGFASGDQPSARLHARDGGATLAVLESTGSTTARMGFAGTGTTALTTVAVGASNNDLLLRAGGVDVTRMTGTELKPVTNNVTHLGSSVLRWLKGWFMNISLFPAASVTPTINGEVTFQLTTNTQLTFRVRGSDGVVRSGNITLA